MAAAKKPARKRKIQASDVHVGSRTLEAVLADLGEVVKECAVRSARAEERSARAEEIAAEALRQSEIAIKTCSLLLKDLMRTTQDLHAYIERTDGRLAALETPAAE